MCKMLRLIPLVFFISPLFISHLAAAKNFSLDLSAGVGESDNSLKTHENEISEIQNRYTAALQGDWKAEWIIADVQYSGYQETFADDSQDGENYLQGDSFVHMGNTQSLWSLDLRHSRRTLLKDVEDKPLAGNQEEREIFSAMPGLRFDLNANNDVLIYADISRTRYLETELRDSDRNTYGADFQHDFSATDSLRLELKKAETDFIYFQQADYALETAALVYEVNLRKLSYSLGAGQQHIKPALGDSSQDDHYQASLGYTSGNNSIRVFYDRSVTDTSFGQGFNLGMSNIPGVDASSDQISLIERSSSGVDLQTTAICTRCTLTLGYTEADDHYLGMEFDAKQRGVTLGFNYLFSKRINLLISHSISDQEPLVLSGAGDDYKQIFSRAILRFNFLRSLSLDVFTEREKRESAIAIRDYTENFTGLSLNYHFE